ncbi:MAG: peptidyl-prolyl cis-trans isomerase [Clostridiaceae bacterium]|jgi:parvulin-like peptidyl-prolyl isomerase|nr:peptidyl-prolyl cis-trans isomerase [Clostridiaceae bacterium]
MSEDEKNSLNTSDNGTPQKAESDQDSTDGGSFVADILGTLGIGSRSSGKGPPAESGKTIKQRPPASPPQLENEVRTSQWGQDTSYHQEADLSQDPIGADAIEIQSPKRTSHKRWLLFPVLLVFAAGTFFLLKNREPTPPAPDVVATYNGKNITTAELKAFIEQEGLKEMEHMICPAHGYDHSKCDPTEECESHPVDSLEGYQQMTARLATEQMVMDWAEENGMLQREDVRHTMSDLLNDVTVSQYAEQLHNENVSVESVSSWEVQQYYDDNRAAYAGKTLSEVEDEIRQTLASQKDENFFPQYIEQLKKTAGLQVNFDILKVTEPTEQEISAYYQKNQNTYAVSESATYLEIRITGSDAASRATDASRKIRSGESFDSVATSFAEGGKAAEQTITKEDAANGGKQKLFTMKVGDISDPIDNGDGSQSILQLKSKKSAGVQPLSEVKAEIRSALLEEKTAQEYEQRKTETLFSIHSRRYTLGDFYTEFLELSEVNQKSYASFDKKKQLVEQIISQELLLEESGDAASGENSHDMEELKIQYLSQMIHQEEVDDKLIDATDEEAQQYYDENLESMVSPATAQLNLIWISQGDNAEKKALAKSKAEEALAALKNGTEFSAVAGQYSEDTSAEIGGEIQGEFHEGDLDPSMSKAISSLAVGEYSEIVDFAGGYYIIQIRERAEKRQLAFEEVSENIKAHLQEQQHAQLEADMEQTLLERFGFTVYDKTLRQLMKEAAVENEAAS